MSTRERPEIGLDLPRCPYCHEVVRAGSDEAKQSCGACMAWHHAECWAEHGGCSACNQRDTEATRAVASRERPQDGKQTDKEQADADRARPAPGLTGLSAALAVALVLTLLGFYSWVGLRREPPRTPVVVDPAAWRAALDAARTETERTAAFARGAEAGDPGAMNMYGFRLLNGIGCDPDLASAATWARRSAEAGHAEGMYGLAFCYEEGLGVVQDLQQAVHWYREAVAHGDTLAGPRLDSLLEAHPHLR